MSEYSIPEVLKKMGKLRKQLLMAAVPLLLFSASAISASVDENTANLEPIDTRIIGGVQATPGEFPFMVSVDGFCGGTIINSRWVMTAAHCTPYISPGNTRLFVGLHNWDAPSGSMAIYAEQVIVHPQYNPATMRNDIALVRLSQAIPAKYTPINPAQLSDAPVGSMVTAAGWGRTSNTPGSGSSTLLKVNLPIVSLQTCANVFTVNDNQICAGTGRQTDTCNGDSGGPLFINKGGRFYQVGITSFGASCVSGYPGVYTKVASYVGWITQVAGQIGDGGGSGGGTDTGTVPAGYTKCTNEGGSCNFSTKVDVAYGANGKFNYKYGVTGTIVFNNANFGDPIPGVPKGGYYKNVAAVTNVAKGKHAEQSSTYSTGGAASRAVDGNTNGEWSANSVTHTNYQKNAFWKVELGRGYQVSKVRIWNRTDCCTSRLSNFTVFLVDGAGRDVAVKTYTGTAGRTTDIDISGSGVTTVHVQLNGTGYLSLAEVEVFGK